MKKTQLIVLTTILFLPTVTFSQNLTHHFSVAFNSSRINADYYDRDEISKWTIFPPQKEPKLGIEASYGVSFKDVHNLFIPFAEIDYNLNRMELTGGTGQVLALHFLGLNVGMDIKTQESFSFTLSLDNSFKIARNKIDENPNYILAARDVDERFRIWLPGIETGAKFLLFQTKTDQTVYVNGSYIFPLRKIFDDRGYNLNFRRFQIGLFVDL